MALTFTESTSYTHFSEVQQPLEKHHVVKLWIVGGVLLLTGATIVTVRSMQKPTSLTSDAFETTTTAAAPSTTKSTVPTTPTIAGAGDSEAPVADSSFGIVTAATDSNTQNSNESSSAALGTPGTCAPGELFSIGAPETSERANPADELNWSGALDVVGEYANPFVVGVTAEAAFPWRTTSQNNDTLTTVVTFTYAGSDAQGDLQLGWSPGKHGDKAKRVLLDNAVLGTTPTHTGQLAGEWWEHMPRFVDILPLTLTPGEHTLTFEHMADPDADAAVWDFISLNLKSCL